jgi:hypothetical protein
MFCCCYCLYFPQDTLNWESFHTKQGHLPTASSIGWHGCHSNWSGRSCQWTLSVPSDVGPLWHHNQVFSDCSSSIRIPAKAPPPAHTCYFGVSNRQDEMAHLLQYPSLHYEDSTEMTFLSCSIQLPIWNLHFGREEVFLLVSTKTPQALCCTIS